MEIKAYFLSTAVNSYNQIKRKKIENYRKSYSPLIICCDLLCHLNENGNSFMIKMDDNFFLLFKELLARKIRVLFVLKCKKIVHDTQMRIFEMKC